VKLKRNEDDLTASGNQNVHRHRAHLSIPLQRRTNLSKRSPLANLVRTASPKSRGPYSLTRVGALSSFAGQKRPPLPPQKSLYKESMNSHIREPPPAQFSETNDPPRQNGHGADPVTRSRNLEPHPPSGPGGRRSHSRKSQRADPMDVDPPTSVIPPRVQENCSVSNVTSDRDESRGDLPRGPKAMTSKFPPAPLTSLPSKPTIPSERYPGRSPPPHLARDERSLQQAGDRSAVDPHSDRHRDMPREHRKPEVASSRRRSLDSVRAFRFEA
jgi:hypothetical protein